MFEYMGTYSDGTGGIYSAKSAVRMKEALASLLRDDKKLTSVVVFNDDGQEVGGIKEVPDGRWESWVISGSFR